MEKGARGPLFLLACEFLELAPREKFYTTPPDPQFSWCGLRLTPTFGYRVSRFQKVGSGKVQRKIN